jgi:hypothetical protein
LRYRFQAAKKNKTLLTQPSGAYIAWWYQDPQFLTLIISFYAPLIYLFLDILEKTLPTATIPIYSIHNV